MQLDKIQKSFKEHMFAEVSAVESPDAEFGAMFDIGNIPLDTRLKIYRNHIVTTLSEVLVMNFPLVEIITGEDFLKTAAKIYLFDNPPTEACLDRYGTSFPDFLTSYQHASNLPYLPDIARLDWVMNEARISKEDSTLTADDLAAADPNTLEPSIFQLKKCVRLLKSNYPLDRIYHFCEEKSDESDTLDASPETTHIMVTRLGWDPKIFKLDEAEYLMLQCLSDEKTLGECLEITMNQFPEFNFGEFLQNYIGLETFSKIIPNT